MQAKEVIKTKAQIPICLTIRLGISCMKYSWTDQEGRKKMVQILPYHEYIPLSGPPWLPVAKSSSSKLRWIMEEGFLRAEDTCRAAWMVAVLRPSSRRALTFSPSWPSSETSSTSLLCERTSVEKVLCSAGVRRERFERTELMWRRVGWDSWVVDVLSFDSSDAKSDSDRVEMYDLIREMRVSRVRTALRRVVRLEITVYYESVSGSQKGNCALS